MSTSIHWQNHSDAKRALAYLEHLDGVGKAVIVHALESIKKRSASALAEEAIRLTQEGSDGRRPTIIK